MATAGSIAAYSPEDNWPQYVEQLKWCGVGREPCHVFDHGWTLNVKRLRRLMPVELANKSFDQLVEVLMKHYRPLPLETVPQQI